MEVQTLDDLKMLRFPAAYIPTRTVVAKSCTTTSYTRVIKVNDDIWLVECKKVDDNTIIHNEVPEQYFGTRTPDEILEHYRGFVFNAASITFKADNKKEV